MIILAIRTDKPEAELYLYEDEQQIDAFTWHAHRQLAETVHGHIDALLKKHNKALSDLGGIVCYQGPGSFTGLRIGLSVANALAYSLQVPAVGGMGDDWLAKSVQKIIAGDSGSVVVPEYGAEVHITQPKHGSKH